MTATCLSAELLALAATDDSSVADHLAGCATCRRLVTAQRATRSALARLSTPPALAHDTRVELGDLLVAYSRPRARGHRFVLAACGVALVALVALASYAILRPSPRDAAIAVPTPTRALTITLAVKRRQPRDRTVRGCELRDRP
jgi:predicted anti-sigma-YlaC factor YlaD